MSRVNGIGTTLLGVSKMDKNNVATATQWFTFLFLPVIPLKRYYVQFLNTNGSEYSYRILSKKKLNLNEILKTYLFGWIIVPSLLFGTVMGIISLMIFLRDLSFVDKHIDFFIPALIIIFVGGWLVSFFYLRGKWIKNRYHPKY